MDIDGLNNCNDQVTVQAGLEENGQSSAGSLHPIIDLNTNIMAIAMTNLTLQRTSRDEKKENSNDAFSYDSELDENIDPVKTIVIAKTKRLKPPVIFRCEICLTEFENAKMLTEHLDVHDFQYSCRTCDANFKLTLDFIDHVREHSTDKLYKCPLCEFVIGKRTKMITHLQSKHDQFKKFRCEICKKGINVYTHFLEHKFIHTNEKPFKCDKCDSSFSQSVSLHSHYARMHVDDPISCDVCQKMCRNKIDLRSHKTTHDRKPAVCVECGKMLSSKDKLRIHERIHTGEKPYLCRMCPKSFKTSSFRSDHERTHTGVKPHICPICNKGFAQRTSMKVHETTHRTDKPFQCSICAKQFKSKIMCNGHVKKCSANSVVASQVNEEVGDNGIGQNVLHEDVLVNPEQYGTLASHGMQDLNHVNVPEQLPWNPTYSYVCNYYNPLIVFNSTSTIPQVHYPNMETNSELSNYVQLNMWGNQNETSQSGNSAQSHQMNLQQEILPISLSQSVNSSAILYGSSQLPMQNTHQVLPSEMGNPQHN